MYMKEERYKEFREIFVNLSADDQFRIYKPVLQQDKDLRAHIYKEIVLFENKYGNPIRWLRKNPDDFAIYKPIMIMGISGKPNMLRALIMVWKWKHSN